MPYNPPEESVTQKDKQSSLPSLPNELLLCIFQQVAQLYPGMLPSLNAVCKDWNRIVKSYENLLWQRATLSAFPGASFHQYLQAPQKTTTGDSDQDWKETFIIHSKWLSRNAQTLVLNPCQPSPITTDSVLQNVPLFESLLGAGDDGYHAQNTQSHNQHQHHHHQYQETSERDLANYNKLIHEPPLVTHQPTFLVTEPQNRPDFDVTEMLSCSLCTYADICMIPQIKVCVRTHRDRSRPLMQVLDWSFQKTIDIDDAVNCHHDLVSGMAVNDQGTLLASCSIDGTVRVWDVDEGWLKSNSGNDSEVSSFESNVQKYGCPIKSRGVLLGHIGWVNAVAIEDTTVVSGGSDHTVRVWDGLSGGLIRIIPNLYFSRPVDHGVYAVAIQGSLIGSGSIIEGYQIHDLETGRLIMDLDEPLTSKDHVRFESLLYQQYASQIAITDTVVVTNSKIGGMLCVWSLLTGKFMYRIQVSPERRGLDSVLNGQTRFPIASPMVTFSVSESSFTNMNGYTTGSITGDVPRNQPTTVHTFKVTRSGSMLMCTLCNGRVSLIDFKNTSTLSMDSWDIRASGHGTLMRTSGNVESLEQGEHLCGTLAWVWMRDFQGRNRVVLV